MVIRTLVIAALMIVPLHAVAQEYDESWTNSMKREFRQACATEMESSGFQSSAAWGYCDCMAVYIEDEFGLAEFGYVTALDERDLPEIESRFEAAIAPCFE